MKNFSELWGDKTVLVAEDEDMNFMLIKEMFRKSDADILRAENGEEAVALFKKHPEVDLVLMDIKMPGINGYEATQEIKKIRNVPVIAQTAFAMAGEEKESYRAGCDEYITKPIRLEILMDLAKKYLNE